MEKKRSNFINRFKKIALDIKTEYLSENYIVEVYFTGRDEDFIVLGFRAENELIEISLELKNHVYEINGHEVISYKIFVINEGIFMEISNEKINLCEYNDKQDTQKYLVDEFCKFLRSVM